MSSTSSGSMNNRGLEALQTALQGLQATATNFASQCIRDSRVRVQYIKDIKAMAVEFQSAVEQGRVTPDVAAERLATLLRVFWSRNPSKYSGRALAP